MKDFFKTLFFGYWNDFDSRIAGYRPTVLFMWAIVIVGIIIPIIIFIKK